MNRRSRAQAEQDLKPFLKHADGCGALQPPYTYCSCGLHFAYEALLSAVRDEIALAARMKATLMRNSQRLPKLSGADWLDHFASDIQAGVWEDHSADQIRRRGAGDSPARQEPTP